MPEPKKDRPATTVAVQKDLPMPRYDYKVPATSSLVIKYDAPKEREKAKRPTERVPSLQNVRLT